MRTRILGVAGLTCVLAGGAATAHAEMCLTIDAARDTLSAPEQAAALLLITRQFENAGEQVVPPGCPRAYTVSHVRLGNVIVVSLVGTDQQREAIAYGLDDLPAVYSQMARSIVTGRPMAGLNVVDRTNVTAGQTSARRVHTDSIWYARVGYGGLFGNTTFGMPAIGFGYRAELDSFGIDVSFLNTQFSSDNSSWSPAASSQSLVKISGLYFVSPTANRSAYLGGGLSFGHQSFGGSYDAANGYYSSGWHGQGLQGELTVGYELARATSFRVFTQVDAIIPFYEAQSETFPVTPPRTGYAMPTTDRRFAPSVVVSMGVGR